MSGPRGRAAQADPLDGDVDEALALANDNRGGSASGGRRDPAAPRDSGRAGNPDRPVSGRTGTDRTGTDRSAPERSATGRPASDKRTTDRSSTDRSSTDRSASGRSSTGGSDSDRPAAERHRATPWPEARRIAERAGRHAARHRARTAQQTTDRPAAAPAATGTARSTDAPGDAVALAQAFAPDALPGVDASGTAQPAGPPGSGVDDRDAATVPGLRDTATPDGRLRLPEAPSPAAPPRPAAPRGAARLPLDQALGLVLASPLTALTDLPSFDTSAMDGWVVAGPGPWDVREEGILAGHDRPEPLADGEAAVIATGARIPPETTAVIRSEHGQLDAKGRLHPMRDVAHGQDIRPRGQECRSGDLLLPAGALVTPAVLGLAAAAGYDDLAVVPRPRVEVLVLGDELLTAGLPRDGLIRDALGPMLPHWLRALGVEVTVVRRLGDDAKALLKAVRGSKADLVVTTGGTASGPVDHVHPTLRALDAELLVDGVKVRPGHPMLLARLKEGQYLVGLPGNPLAAVSGLLTLAEPLLRELSGRAQEASGAGASRAVDDAEAYGAPLHSSVHGHPHDTRLVPVVLRQDRGSGHEWAVPLHYNGPAMLRGIAAADALAVVPPGGAKEGEDVEILDLPWSWTPGLHTATPGLNSPRNEGCFT